jgi:hypothetical protein
MPFALAAFHARRPSRSPLQLVCPLCDQAVDGDGSIIELHAERSPELAVCMFGCATGGARTHTARSHPRHSAYTAHPAPARPRRYAAFHGEEASRVASEAIVFARTQTALYGA